MSSFTSPGSRPPKTDPAYALKGEARQLQIRAQAQGRALSHAAALEHIAHTKGFRDWNCLCASLSQTAGSPDTAPTVFLWQRLEDSLPQLPLGLVKPDELRRHASIVEVMRWARQLEFIAEKVPPEHRRDSLELIGERYPYVLECSPSRWPDGRYHLCDRGYGVFKAVSFSMKQLVSLGLPQWNEQYGQHGGTDDFTVIGDDCRYTRKEDRLKRMARLIASLAVEANKPTAVA